MGRRIRRNERHLLALINDILDFSKLEAGAVRLDIRDVKIADVATSLESLIGPLFISKGVKYAVAACDEKFTVQGDEERIVQICLNLLSNALKRLQQVVKFWCHATIWAR
jgi:signal transduction histidine kinase